MEHSSKELPLLDILIKNVNVRIITDINHKPTDANNISTLLAPHPPKKNCIKSIPYTLGRRIDSMNTDKNLRKTRLKELHTILHQRGYPTTLINNGFVLAEKIPHKELRNPKKQKQRETPCIRRKLQQNKNYSELFREIIKKIQKNLKTMTKSKKYKIYTKTIKSQRQTKKS